MTAKPPGDAPDLTLAEIDVISGGVVRRRPWNLSNPRVLETVRRLVMVGHRAR